MGYAPQGQATVPPEGLSPWTGKEGWHEAAPEFLLLSPLSLVLKVEAEGNKACHPELKGRTQFSLLTGGSRKPVRIWQKILRRLNLQISKTAITVTCGRAVSEVQRGLHLVGPCVQGTGI